MNLLIILNPKAGSGRALKKQTLIKNTLRQLGIDCDFVLTEYPGHGSELVATSTLERYDGVIAAGGDGTVFEVLNGLYQHPESARVPLGLIPIGTGNAFARDLELQPSDWSSAIKLIHRGRTRKVDTGHVKTADGEYYFLNIVGMGFSVDAGQTAKKLKFIGNTAYTVATLWEVMRLKSYPLVVEIDGEEFRQDNVFVTISNTRYTGTHFRIAPAAVLDDGLLDLTLLTRLPRHRLLKLFPTIYQGRHVEYKEVVTRQASHIVIHSPEAMLLGPDGEFRGKTPAEIRCLHQDLEIFI